MAEPTAVKCVLGAHSAARLLSSYTIDFNAVRQNDGDHLNSENYHWLCTLAFRMAEAVNNEYPLKM